jgi:sugar O-acyltransferase (sialic acid O-acetyltransferase NeuD family)
MLMSPQKIRPLIIFGTGELARLAHYYFTHDSPRTVAAFTVDQEWLGETSYEGLPVVGYEDLEKYYPPGKFDLFIAVGYSKLNQARAEKYQDARNRGYRLASYVSSRSINYPDLNIGENCFVMEGTQIQPFATIGNNVIIWSGCMISHHVEICDHCFIAAHAVISGMVKIEPYCFIGVNATLREKIVLARKTIIGAGALILRSTEENETYLGVASDKSGIPSNRFQSML